MPSLIKGTLANANRIKLQIKVIACVSNLKRVTIGAFQNKHFEKLTGIRVRRAGEIPMLGVAGDSDQRAHRFRQSEVKGMNLLLAVVAVILTGLSFLMYTRSADNKLWLVGVVVFLIAALVFGGLYLSGRVNKGEDIHITE